MGGRRKNKNKEIDVKHISSGIYIINSPNCQSCPNKIYSKEDDKVTFGTGSIYSNTMFILPTYDTKSKVGYNTMFTLLREVYESITGLNMLENIYITRLVKCYTNNEHNLYNQSINHCGKFLNYEVSKLPMKNVVFFGDTYDDYVNSSNLKVKLFKNKYINKVYSPGVLFYDNSKLKDVFVEQLTKAININI